VEKESLLHLHLPAAQPPVRSQQEMKSEKFMFGFTQNTLADETKIRDIFFVFTTPNLAPIYTSDDLEPRMAHVLFFLDAIAEARKAAPEYTSEDTITGRFRGSPACSAAQSKSLALRAGFLRDRDGIRTAPIKFHEYLLTVGTK
jgi:hypothetical protein